MRKSSNGIWIASIITVLIATGTLLATAAAQKADAPKPHNYLAMGEEQVKQLLLLIRPDRKGMISKQEYLKFMEAEFDRLDKDKKGELDASKFVESNLTATRYVGK
jgi:hypothetical protein